MGEASSTLGIHQKCIQNSGRLRWK